MSYTIEVLSIGESSDAKIGEAIQILNGVQKEFQYKLPPLALRDAGAILVQNEYHTDVLFDFLREYRTKARGHRPFLIAVVNGKLSSKRWRNIFGSHEAKEGLAIITLHDHTRFADSYRSFLCYYLIRYALSFVSPELKAHKDTRGCYFDFKRRKADLGESLRSGSFCDVCKEALAKNFNSEIRGAIVEMVRAMKAQHEDSKDILQAASLKASTQIGIIAIRDDEFEAVIKRFPSRRRAVGKNRYYEFIRVRDRKDLEIGVAAAKMLEQGPNAAHAIARDMIDDFSPKWILLVGIAGGFPDSDYTLGDVVLGSRVHDFLVTAALEDGEVQYQQQGGAVHKEVEKLLAHLAAMKEELDGWNEKVSPIMPKPIEKIPPKPDGRYYGPLKWRSKVHRALSSQFPKRSAPRNPIFKIAPILTAATLLKNTSLAETWRKTARQAAGVEMELGGVYVAARFGGDGETRVLAIRGISDVVGYRRAPEWTEYACVSASIFAEALIKSGLLTD